MSASEESFDEFPVGEVKDVTVSLQYPAAARRRGGGLGARARARGG
jgi:hypothetical protein